MEPLIISNEISINAPKAKVWEALITPKLTTAYMFGCEALSDWVVGNTLIWKGAQDGVIYVKGHVTEFNPEYKLGFTVFDPNEKYEDIPENYLTTIYTLEQRGAITHVSVEQGDYTTVVDGEKRYQHSLSQGGWQYALNGLKELLEGNVD